ncbi:hypothetical protein [Shewanella sp. UCD-KL12]|uniref:hypothetical protein n=1 Tax=Shewanella sp. UCD-KL12 TaxID=1917163 RepID=UPI000970EC6E|nr:hypothetical protein [Shewanella sp. UCD-KL12]
MQQLLSLCLTLVLAPIANASNTDSNPERDEHLEDGFEKVREQGREKAIDEAKLTISAGFNQAALALGLTQELIDTLCRETPEFERVTCYFHDYGFDKSNAHISFEYALPQLESAVDGFYEHHSYYHISLYLEDREFMFVTSNIVTAPDKVEVGYKQGKNQSWMKVQQGYIELATYRSLDEDPNDYHNYITSDFTNHNIPKPLAAKLFGQYDGIARANDHITVNKFDDSKATTTLVDKQDFNFPLSDTMRDNFIELIKQTWE